MRPDRIIVGEVRGAETLDMLQAMNTGHEGSLTTIHANTPRDALSRLETLVHDRRRRAAAPRDPRADRVGLRPARADPAPRRRLAPRHAHHRGRRHGVRRRHAAGHLPGDSRRTKRTPTGRAPRLLSPLAPTGLKPHFIDKIAANGVVLPADVLCPPARAGRGTYNNPGFGGYR